jgi:mevalonate pyrophosphate decarboxylase
LLISSQVAYTFDAGPNACLYLLESEVPKLLPVINHIFPPGNESVEYLKGIPVEKQPVSQVSVHMPSFSRLLQETFSFCDSFKSGVSNSSQTQAKWIILKSLVGCMSFSAI